jgi:hypothetical protein
LRNYVIPIIGIVVLLPAVYTSFYPSPGYPLLWAPWLILIWVALGIIYLAWRRFRRERIDLDYAFRDIGETVPDAARDTEPGA